MAIVAKVVGKKLIIEADIPETLNPSKTGKSLMVASTNGNQPTTANVNGKPVILGLNAYIKVS